MVALALSAAPASAQTGGEALQMAPASDWVMDYAADSCALRRAFEADGQRALLEMRQFGPGETFQVTVGSDTLSRTSRKPRVRFEPDSELVDPGMVYVFDRDETHGVLYTDSFRPSSLRLGNSARSGTTPAWSPADRFDGRAHGGHAHMSR
jgi:hypothetical protein